MLKWFINVKLSLWRIVCPKWMYDIHHQWPFMRWQHTIGYSTTLSPSLSPKSSFRGRWSGIHQAPLCRWVRLDQLNMTQLESCFNTDIWYGNLRQDCPRWKEDKVQMTVTSVWDAPCFLTSSASLWRAAPPNLPTAIWMVSSPAEGISGVAKEGSRRPAKARSWDIAWCFIINWMAC